MTSQGRKSSSRFLTGSFVLMLLLAGCAPASQSCPAHPLNDLSGAAAFAEDTRYAFQFPLDETTYDTESSYNRFCMSSRGPASKREYHAAEDYYQPAGTPVYAIADGEVSFSGPMGGYGWLIIIDHPQANIYSLYGHLSPSRWRMRSGTVEKGEMIAYLGDADENGGSAENPLRPHLHFGIRAGQRADYSGMGEWRWEAGWIKPCPLDAGWLHPSAIITGQDIPAGGFPQPAGFLAKWGIELLFAGIYLFGGGCMLVYATKQDKAWVLVFAGAFLTVAGWVFRIKGERLDIMLFAMAALSVAIGVKRLLRRSSSRGRAPNGGAPEGA